MKHKTFANSIILATGVFILLNLLVWELYTKKLLSFTTGDLSRLGYFSDMAVDKNFEVDLPKRHIVYRGQGGVPDIIVIGDSFTNSGGQDKNPYYQDYIATFNDYTVLNITQYGQNDFLTTVAMLSNSGWLDEHRPKAVLIQTVARNCVAFYSIDFNLEKTDTVKNIVGYYKGLPPSKAMSEQVPPKARFINTGNLKFLLYKILYYFSDHAFYSQVYAMKLDRPLFSTGSGDKLLIYYKDIMNLRLNKEASVKRLNDNLNRLAKKLGAKGVRLYFMPTVDKYDLYSAYIKDNPYPRNDFFDKLEGMTKAYTLINTKEILSSELARGEMDIYHPDDTHWTWKASKKIFETVRFE